MCHCIGVGRVADDITLRLAVGGVRASRALKLLLMASRPLSFRDITSCSFFIFWKMVQRSSMGENVKKNIRKQA